MSLNDRDVDLLCDIARDAGRAILALYGTALCPTAKPDDSPLTQADTDADAIIRARLSAAFPGVLIVSEESTAAEVPGADVFFLVDPLGVPYTFVAAGSSLKFCRIAEGRADLYPRFGHTSQWDTAAAQAVLERAGGRVADLGGEPLCYGSHRPVLNPFFMAIGDPCLAALIDQETHRKHGS
jgi:3'-phosphoadenosine 5'-phosphosulfate (PAPS) 3'-phosphatase